MSVLDFIPYYPIFYFADILPVKQRRSYRRTGLKIYQDMTNLGPKVGLMLWSIIPDKFIGRFFRDKIHRFSEFLNKNHTSCIFLNKNSKKEFKNSIVSFAKKCHRYNHNEYFFKSILLWSEMGGHACSIFVRVRIRDFRKCPCLKCCPCPKTWLCSRSCPSPWPKS